MSKKRDSAKAWGRVGGLEAWSRHSAETMLGGALRGFRARFERLVDPEGVLDPEERQRRAARAMRAHMLKLAARSAQVRSARARDEAPDAEVSLDEAMTDERDV